MTFKPAVWFPIAVVLSLGNLVAVWFAAVPAEPLHATIHAALSLGSGLWAYRLRQRLGEKEHRLAPEAVEALDALETLEIEASKLRQELSEAQERLDFAERLLAQNPDSRRMGRER
jgi:predicted outer membrane protein